MVHWNRQEMVVVAITRQDDSLVIKRIIKKAWNVFRPEWGTFEQNVTDEFIERKVQAYAPVKRWRVIKESDLPNADNPEDRSTRDRWRDDGEKIYVADE